MDRSFYESEIDALQKKVLAAQAIAIERGDALLAAQVELNRLKDELTAEVAKGSGRVGCATTTKIKWPTDRASWEKSNGWAR